MIYHTYHKLKITEKRLNLLNYTHYSNLKDEKKSCFRRTDINIPNG